MMIKEMIGKILAGERDGTTLWKIAISEIDYPMITDPVEGVWVAALAENILRFGQLQPVLVSRVRGEGAKVHPYRLITGRRRVEAMRMLGHTQVSAIVVRCDFEREELLALSENMLHREQNYWELATRARKLVDGGIETERLAAMLALPVSRLQELLDLLELPADEARLMRMVRVSLEDAARLKSMPALARREILDRCHACPDLKAADLIDEWTNGSDQRSAKLQKVCVGDVRLFINTVERAVETMKSAGFDARIERRDDVQSHVFTVRVAKRSGVALGEDCADDVSRETLSPKKEKPRFSSALSIFEALAEDECSLAVDVSRETFMEGLSISKENPEKHELCIDCLSKKCYNSEQGAF